MSSDLIAIICLTQPPYVIGETLKGWAPWIFGLSAVAGFAVVFRYNLLTAKLWKDVDRVAREEGRKWLPRSDRGQRFRFVFAPKKLLDSSDTPRLLEAKKRLLRHRDKVLLTLVFGWLCVGLVLIVGFSAAYLIASQSAVK